MAILLDSSARIIVQGITGNVGRTYAKRMLANGTPVVAGVTPGKGGTTVFGLPVFDTVYEARKATGATASLVTVPARFVKEAVLEAIDAGIKLIVVYTEHTPVHDAMEMCAHARARGAILIGPNSAGCVTPGQANMSDLNDANLRPGPVGIVSKSGTLTYEVIDQLSRVGLGLSTVVCLGGDPVVGTQYEDVLPLFERDPETKAVVLIGELGGLAEVRAAEIIKTMSKPVVAFIAGSAAPKGKRMGHAGALTEGGEDTAQRKKTALAEAGCVIAEQITDIGAAIAQVWARISA